MGNVYSAQNIASYLLFELKEKAFMPTKQQLQQLLRAVDDNWEKIFGCSAFREEKHTHQDYYIYEVYKTYNEQFDTNIIPEPAMEWHLPFGQFQLVRRTYAVPAYSPLEEIVVKKVIEKFFSKQLLKVS